MNWFLVVVAVLMSVVTLFINIRLLKVYLDPEEGKLGGGYFPKATIVLGLTLAAFISLLLPFDVANRKDPTIRDDTGGGLDVALMWQITLWSVVGMTVVVLPFALFYYEAWDPDTGAPITMQFRDTDASGLRVVSDQIASAICWTTGSVVLFVGVLAILYFGVGIGRTEMEYDAEECPGVDERFPLCVRYNTSEPGSCPADNVDLETVRAGCEGGSGVLEIQVSFFVFTVGLLTCIGWVLFVVFGGVGLSSLPVEMCQSYYENKLVAMTREKYRQEADMIKTEARTLIEVADRLLEKLKNNKTNQKKVTAFQVAVDKLEKRHRRNQAYNEQSPFARLSSPLIIYGRLLLGVICVVWTAMWIVHIVVYNTLEYHPMLNNLFITLDGAFSLLGVLAYTSFSFYLLWAMVNGCMKVGMNFLIFTIHPMKIGGTMTSSFVFNVILILFAAVAVASFCAMSFRDYAANTVVDTLYSSYISKLKYLRYIMEYFQYGLLGFAFLGLVFYLCKGPRKAEDILRERDDDED